MSPLIAFVVFQAAPYDPAKDPALAKPVTVRLAMVPLRTLLADVAKQTGQPVRAAGSIDTWKATVLVKGLPAGRTMEALADTLGLVWTKTESSILLGRPEGGAAAEANYVKAERAERQKNAPAAPAMAESGGAFRPGRMVRGRRGEREVVDRKVVYSRFDPTLLAVEGAQTQAPTRLEPEVPTGTDEFSKAVAAWPKVAENLGPEWGKQVASPALPKPVWAGELYSLGDLLTAWHDATGLPVVADAFRVPMPQAALGFGSGLSMLQGLAAGNHVALKVTDGVARVRHPGFWRLREQEIPDSTWSVIERNKPTLNDYASFASRLSVPQAASFRSREAPLSKVSTIPLQDAYPALTLWSALPAQAKQAVLAGRPLPLSAVPNASNAFGFALREAPYYKAGDPTRALQLPLPQLGFFGTAGQGSLDLRLGGEQVSGVVYTLPL